MNNTVLIGVAGGSGSGKTCFVESLLKQFEPNEISIISMDNYYLPREAQKEDEKGIRNFDLPDSLDHEQFYQDLLKLKSGQSVQRQEYVFNNAHKEPKMLTFKPAPVLIIEGLFLFYYKQIAELLDYKLFINASDYLKVIRRIKRDGIERNYPLDDVLYRYDHHVNPSYKAYIEPYIEKSDIVVNNFDNYDQGLKLVVGFIQSLLK